MNKNPSVSIVTPSFNQASFLEATILSVIGQDYSPIEYMIIDGGSTDGSVDIIKKYENKLAYWASEPDKGQADAINKGWLRCKGDIVAYLNSDDTYEPGAIKAAVEIFNQYPSIHFVYGDLNVIDENGRFISRFSAPDFKMRTFIGDNCYTRQPTTFFRMAALKEAGMLNTNMHYAFDYELFIRICSQFDARRIPRVMANFRRHKDSKTLSGQANNSEYTFWPEEKKLLEAAAENAAFSDDVRAVALRRIGLHYYEHMELSAARQMFIKAVRLGNCAISLDSIRLFLQTLFGERIIRAVRKIKEMSQRHPDPRRP